MQLLSILSLAAAFGAVAAQDNTVGNTYQLRVYKKGADFHHSLVSAWKGGFTVDGQPQTADCARPQEYATFVIRDREAYMYTGRNSENPQQLFTDRSGMGRGILGYLSGPHGIPENWQTGPWDLNEKTGVLSFEGANFWACPRGDWPGYKLWLGQFEPDCVKVKVKAEKVKKPVKCSYKRGQ